MKKIILAAVAAVGALACMAAFDISSETPTPALRAEGDLRERDKHGRVHERRTQGDGRNLHRRDKFRDERHDCRHAHDDKHRLGRVDSFRRRDVSDRSDERRLCAPRRCRISLAGQSTPDCADRREHDGIRNAALVLKGWKENGKQIRT